MFCVCWIPHAQAAFHEIAAMVPTSMVRIGAAFCDSVARIAAIAHANVARIAAQVGWRTEGIEVRAVENSKFLHQTALIEAFNLKAAIECVVSTVVEYQSPSRNCASKLPHSHSPAPTATATSTTIAPTTIAAITITFRSHCY